MSIMSYAATDETRVVTEGILTVYIDPIDVSTVRISVFDRRTGETLMREVVGASDSDDAEESSGR